MEHSKLDWEDVIQFEEVKGYGQHIWRDGNTLYYVTEEGGIAPQRVVYELPNELFALLESGERTIREVSYRVKNNCWPPTEEEKKASEKQFILKGLTPLIANPKSWELFTQEELERLIPLAEKNGLTGEGNFQTIMFHHLSKRGIE